MNRGRGGARRGAAPARSAAAKGPAAVAPPEATARVLSLQRDAGNRATAALLARASVSRPGDMAEREAERFASTLARRGASHAGAPGPLAGGRGGDGKRRAGGASAGAMYALLGPGTPLSARRREPFEAALGSDMSHVRVHTGERASALAATLSARAFAVGPHVAFGEGRFAPGARAGRRLLGHELAHVAESDGAPAPAGGRGRRAATVQRSVDPAIANEPGNAYVDAFLEAYYDLDYRAEGGNLSTWLTLEYRDGTLIDVNIYEFLETDTPIDRVTTEMSNGYLGLGRRIFPRTLTRQTAPRLWAAREAAIEVMEEYNLEFMMATLPAVFFILSLGIGGGPVAPAARVRPGSAATRVRVRQRGSRGGGGGGSQTSGSAAGAQATASATASRQAVGFTRHARGAPALGGFKAGVSEAEIVALNRQFGGITTITGHPSSALAAAARQQGFWKKAAAIVREIAGRHMFNDANKRTATAVVQELQRRNQVVTGVSGSELRAVIGRVARGELRTIEEIAVALRGF